MPLGFYNFGNTAASVNNEPCLTCCGKGVLWEQPRFDQFDMNTPLDAAKRYWERTS